jgi:pyruvate-ferredoxin/flavodoxin oxidoreductase
MQGNAFLGAFFAVSRCLKEFGITQEQYRDVVHKQYVKKFGKLGDAVVQSNMEVMTQGFEQVKEIRIGEARSGRSSSLARRGAAADSRKRCGVRNGDRSCGTLDAGPPVPAGSGSAHAG